MERNAYTPVVGQVEVPIVHHNVWNWGESWFFASDGGRVVCGLDWLNGENNTYVHGLSATLDARGKGKATQLLGYVVNFSRTLLGMQKVHLCVEYDKPRLIEFYRLRGWHVMKNAQGEEILDDNGYAWMEAD